MSLGGGVKLQNLLLQLPKGSPESKAVEAGQIDAVIDRAGSNVILLPAARRALREIAKLASVGNQEAADEPSVANNLLAALPRAEYQSLLAGLEPLTLRSGQILQEPGARIANVYFPIDCVVSLLATAEGEKGLEVGLVGYEGMIGIALVLGTEVSSVRALVQASGTALRMKAVRFQAAFLQCLPLRRELYRYAHEKLALARQTVACNCFHAVEARLARWLLMTSDRMLSEEFPLTQAFLADMLGVRRTTINEAAQPLQQRRLIRYSRGRIRILDRPGLEAASCRCYTKIERPRNGG
jgi:CRP-like cAMP-binding protein